MRSQSFYLSFFTIATGAYCINRGIPKRVMDSRVETSRSRSAEQRKICCRIKLKPVTQGSQRDTHIESKETGREKAPAAELREALVLTNIYAAKGSNSLIFSNGQ